jgi:hypothetical protein
MRGESLAYKLLRLHKRISIDVLKSEQYVGFLGAYTRRIVSASVAFPEEVLLNPVLSGNKRKNTVSSGAL